MLQEHYIKVILPLRLEWEPCYTTAAQVRIGDRVAVIFAGRRVVGVVSDAQAVPDIDPSRIHPVHSVETGLESISPEEIRLWRFVADYYMCTIGEVYKAAYPGLKTASEESGARAKARRVEMEERSRVQWQKRIARLEERLAAKQKDLSGRHGEVVRHRLEEQKRAIASELEDARARLSKLSFNLDLSERDYSLLLKYLPELKQDAGLQKLMQGGKPVLLKAPDRVEIYAAAAGDVVRKGKNVLVLVNESTLAGSLNDRLKSEFGNLVLVQRAGTTKSDQRRINDALRSGRPYILVGTRSSIFAAHRNLGLVIVENEESRFYKQTDSAPRYNARDCAVQLSVIHRCKIILGSASPSLESLQNAISGRYSLYEPAKEQNSCRYILVDTVAERRKNGMVGHFSRKLLSAMRDSTSTAIIRGFEKAEDLEGVHADIFTIPQAAKTDLSSYGLVAFLSAEALFDTSDFRSDEHAYQYLERLRSTCRNVVVQTSQAAHQVFSMNNAYSLLQERRDFRLPPFTRLVDVHTKQSLERELTASGFIVFPMPDGVRVVLNKDKSLIEKKKELRKILSGVKCVIDVDPF